MPSRPGGDPNDPAVPIIFSGAGPQGPPGPAGADGAPGATGATGPAGSGTSLSTWTTPTRPSPTVSVLGYNSTISDYEFWDSTRWINVGQFELNADTTYYISNLSGTVTPGSGYTPGTYLGVSGAGIALTTNSGPGSGGTADFVITLLGTFAGTAGSGYVAGIYINVPLIYFSGSGTGTLATADIQVGTEHTGGLTGDTVTSVRMRPNGTTGYLNGDVLKVNDATLGGGTGFRFTLTASGGAVTSFRPHNNGSGYTSSSVLGVSAALVGGTVTTPFSFAVSAAGSDSNDGLTTATPWRTLQHGANWVAGVNQNDHLLLFQLADGVYDGATFGNMPYNNVDGTFTIQGNTSDSTKVQLLSNSANAPAILGPSGIAQVQGTEFFKIQYLTFNITQTDFAGFGIVAQNMGYVEIDFCTFITTAPVVNGVQAYSGIVMSGDGGQLGVISPTVDGGIWRAFMEFAGASENYFYQNFTFNNTNGTFPSFTSGVFLLTNDCFLELGVPTRNPVISFWGTCTGPRFSLGFDPTLIYANTGFITDLPGTTDGRYRDTCSMDGISMARNGFVTPPRLVAALPAMPNSAFAGHRLTVANARVAETGTVVAGTTGVVVTITGSPGNALVTWTAHGLAAGTQVVIASTGAVPAPLVQIGPTIVDNPIYYVLAPAANTFNLARTPGGAAVAITTAGSGTHTAYAGRTGPVISDGVAWRVDSGPPLSAATTFYVATTGNDANDGSLSTPWLTIQKAADYISGLDFGGQQVTIQIQDGTYGTAGSVNGGANFFGPYKDQGTVPVLIKGNLATPTNVNINGFNRNALGFQGNGYWEIGGFSVSASGFDSVTQTSAAGLGVFNFADVGIANAVAGGVDFRAVTANQIYVSSAVLLQGTTGLTVNGNATNFANVQHGQAFFQNITWAGTRTYSGVNSGTFFCLQGYTEFDGTLTVGGTVTGAQAVIADGGIIQAFTNVTLPGTLPIVYNDRTAAFIDNNLRSTFQNPDYNRRTDATGASLTMNNHDWHLIIDSTTGAPIPAWTVTLCPAPVDGQIVNIRSSKNITSFTLNANAGQTLAGAPAAGLLTAGVVLEGIYIGTTWYF